MKTNGVHIIYLKYVYLQHEGPYFRLLGNLEDLALGEIAAHVLNYKTQRFSITSTYVEAPVISLLIVTDEEVSPVFATGIYERALQWLKVTGIYPPYPEGDSAA